MHPNRHTAIERNSGMLSSTEVTFFLHVGGCLEVSIYPWNMVERLESTGMLLGNTAGLEQCHECPIGSFSNMTGLAECYKCPVSTW